MAKVFRVRRGTTTSMNAFTGKLGEITMDTDKKTVVLHDGSKAGGYPLQRADGTAPKATSADKLTTARNIQVNLASTSAASFNGSANATPGVTGTLGVGNGGTGRTDGHAPKDVLMSGSRGNLAGYETPLVQATALTISNTSRDTNLVTGAVKITVNNGASNQAWTKSVTLTNASATITIGSNWKWAGGSAPDVSANCALVLHWCSTFGIASLVTTS